jgi:cyanophycinase
MTSRSPAEPRGALLLIGGHEDKEHERVILREVAERARRQAGPLVLITAATELPTEYAADYMAVFADLGVDSVEQVDVRTRQDAHDAALVKRIGAATVIFFTGGDQLRIVSQIGGSPLLDCLRRRYQEGALIAGTSAGAAAMPQTMLIAGPSDASHEADALDMGPGLGLAPGIVTDTHFAQRGRIGRLMGAVARNPGILGIGIDEDTAVLVERGTETRVLGSGAVYVADGSDMSYTSLAERRHSGIVSIHDLRLHVLGAGQEFDLVARRPRPPADAAAA